MTKYTYAYLRENLLRDDSMRQSVRDYYLNFLMDNPESRLYLFAEGTIDRTVPSKDGQERVVLTNVLLRPMDVTRHFDDIPVCCFSDHFNVFVNEQTSKRHKLTAGKTFRFVASLTVYTRTDRTHDVTLRFETESLFCRLVQSLPYYLDEWENHLKTKGLEGSKGLKKRVQDAIGSIKRKTYDAPRFVTTKYTISEIESLRAECFERFDHIRNGLYERLHQERIAQLRRNKELELLEVLSQELPSSLQVAEQ